MKDRRIVRILADHDAPDGKGPDAEAMGLTLLGKDAPVNDNPE